MSEIDRTWTEMAAAALSAIGSFQPTPLGDFSARIKQAMQAMRAIERANDELFAHSRRPDGLSADEHQVHLLMARMRATAARLWLLTLQARAVGEGGAGPRLGVAGLWTRLQTVPRDMLPERAVAFTGAFDAGIRSEPIDVSAWPFSP